jgi:hypothetical protein
VDRSVDLEDQAQFGAVEVHNETPDDMLAAKLEAEAVAVSENPPGEPFRSGLIPSQLLRERCLDASTASLASHDGKVRSLHALALIASMRLVSKTELELAFPLSTKWRGGQGVRLGPSRARSRARETVERGLGVR